MEKQLLYSDLAKYYDFNYSAKKYKEESEIIKKLINKHKKSKGNSLLDVGCGTGRHLRYLISDFDCMGVDLNSEMLKIAKERLEGISLEKANMISMNLNKKFDIIICLFSSIGYVKTYENLRITLRNFFNHLKKGGIVIIEPWLKKSDYKVGHIDLNTYETNKFKISRLSFSDIKDNISVIEMQYIIAKENLGIEHFMEKHKLGLFEIDETLNIMKEVGFDAKYSKEGLRSNRGLYTCVKI